MGFSSCHSARISGTISSKLLRAAPVPAAQPSVPSLSRCAMEARWSHRCDKCVHISFPCGSGERSLAAASRPHVEEMGHESELNVERCRTAQWEKWECDVPGRVRAVAPKGLRLRRRGSRKRLAKASGNALLSSCSSSFPAG